MKLSVILPCYNGAATLAVQLDALTRQRFRRAWELVVVDNGSTDASMAIVEGYRERLPLRIVQAHRAKEPRRPVTHSYAVGFAAARGDAFLLCEADDEVADDWMRTLYDALVQQPFVAAALEYTRLNAPSVVPRWQQQARGVGLSCNAWPRPLPYASGCSLGIRRSVYERVGDPDEQCAASWDTDYCWRAALAGIPLTFVPETCVHYRMRATLEGAYAQGKSWGASHTALQRKYHPYATRWEAVKLQARNVRALLAHCARGSAVARREENLSTWVWGVGWNVAMVAGGAETFRRVSAPP